jgi:hypothetical protein
MAAPPKRLRARKIRRKGRKGFSFKPLVSRATKARLADAIARDQGRQGVRRQPSLPPVGFIDRPPIELNDRERLAIELNRHRYRGGVR